MDWSRIITGLNKILSRKKQGLSLEDRIAVLEQKRDRFESVAWRILEVKKKGFLVKTEGLFAYISFTSMPWSYERTDCWKAVFPWMKGKFFFGKVHSLTREPLHITLNAHVPQFRKPELKVNEKYQGIVIYRYKEGIFVELGYHFRWNCGSLIGFLHKSHFKSEEEFGLAVTGKLIDVCYLGFSDNRIVIGKEPEYIGWFNGEADALASMPVAVKVGEKNQNGISFTVNEHFKAVIPVTKLIYPDTKRISRALRNLEPGDVLSGEVIEVDFIRKNIKVKWTSEEEIDRMIVRNTVNSKPGPTPAWPHHAIGNLLEKEIVEKLGYIGKTVQVEVLKTHDMDGRMFTQYLVENKHKGSLIPVSKTYQLSRSEINRILKDLADGENLECEVTGISKKTLKLTWNIPDDKVVNLQY